MSQFSSFIACQRPLKLGFPSIRCTLAGAWLPRAVAAGAVAAPRAGAVCRSLTSCEPERARGQEPWSERPDRQRERPRSKVFLSQPLKRQRSVQTDCASVSSPTNCTVLAPKIGYGCIRSRYIKSSLSQHRSQTGLTSECKLPERNVQTSFECPEVRPLASAPNVPSTSILMLRHGAISSPPVKRRSTSCTGAGGAAGAAAPPPPRPPPPPLPPPPRPPAP